MVKEELLRRADDHIFSMGLNDSGSRLGLANMRYGLAKIHWVQERLGLLPDGVFIAAPDLTVTRNRNRWRSGFGYGGKLAWGDGGEEFIVLDLKPNCCGMLVGGLESLPSSEGILERAQALKSEEQAVVGVAVAWDFHISNHFIGVYRVERLTADPLPGFVFVMHCSGGELRGQTSLGDGLYWDESEALRKKADLFETPFGPLRVLVGSRAAAYYEFFGQAEAFAKARRCLAGERLFGDYHLISNATHQGLVNMNTMVLGAYNVEGTDSPFPLMLRADLPAYLVKGKTNLSSETVSALGFEERARQVGVYEELRSASIIPHGGGYTFPHLDEVLSVADTDGERCFEVSIRNDGRRQFLSDVRSLAFAYRGEEVLSRVLDLGMAELLARLDLVHAFKV
ncbi:MAG: hypothetical protein WBB22_05285 [Anaerolineae bacterium]